MKKNSFFFCLLCLLNGTVTLAQDGLPPVDFEKRMATQFPQLLDVRTAFEYQSGHLKHSLQADWLNKDQFADRIQYLDRSKPLLVYCASGGRSAQAARWLLENGFKDVQNLKGGLTAWKLDNRPLEATNTTTQLSIDRYQALAASPGKVLVDFGAEWCPPCKKMEPVLQQLQADLKDRFTLLKVDGGIDIDVMKAMKVDALPTFIIYSNGKEIWRKQGVAGLDELKKKLK